MGSRLNWSESHALYYDLELRATDTKTWVMEEAGALSVDSSWGEMLAIIFTI